MRVIRRYLFRSIIGTIALVLAVLLGLATFIEFVTQLDDIGTGSYGILQTLIYTLLKLPNIAYQVLPMAVLLGALLGLGGLANHGELIILRASGVSLIRLAGSVMWTGLALSLFALILGEYIGPRLDNYARQYRAAAKHTGQAVATGRSAWIRDGDTFLNVSRLTDDFRLGGIYLYRMDSAGQLVGVGRADSAGVDDADQWVLSNFAESQFVDNGVKTSKVRRLIKPNNLSSDLIGLTVVRPDSLTGQELFRYVRYLQRNELDTRRYEVAFWSRIAAAVAVTPMCVLALPFVFGRMRSSGAGAKMVVGLLVGLVYFLTSRGLADGGQVYELDPLLIAWLPTVALMAATGVAILRSR
ncbi:MAG: LPS export ABC transporter permease LptG [Gammaproteobacteria bacterium]|jgi:lipopolysaccharide export system permease protein|nr:LPS export ABC transporter permease LptG [Chromatiales bacterium]MDP6675003.1 LPS export ABC transporter permease LptG [Gammaproteobacteria bacterium]